MAETRAWAWFTGGLASGLGLFGLYHWRFGRKAPLGRIYKIGDRFYADSAVVDELVRRVPGSERIGATGAHIYLYRRGKLTFESELGYGQLPGQIGPHILRMYAYDTSVEDLAVELIRFGLALPGGAFPTWPIEGPRGTWTPPAAPLHPSALDPRRKAALAVGPLKEPPPRPIGHYFQVGQNFYADENFLRTLEGFQGAEFDRRAIVPLWRRGHLELFQQTSAKMVPEQVGDLHRIEPHLSGVSLADLMIELESLGLVSWGGTWPRFPDRLAGYVPTGPLTEKTFGRVYRDGGRYYLDETARRNLLSRLLRDQDRVLWRGQALLLPEAAITPPGGGALHVVTPAKGRTEDELVRAFVEELVLHRIARRAEFRSARPQPSGDESGVVTLRAATEKLVATLPRPDLAPLRIFTRTPQVPPGTLAVLPLDPAEAVVFEPEDRYALALHLPSGQGFMFSFEQLADPAAEDLVDPSRLWEWGDPDTEAVVLAEGLDWNGIAAVLGIDPVELDRVNVVGAVSLDLGRTPAAGPTQEEV
jgi:hypothetical protein